ncbi:MAG: hypothetical protein ABSF98_29615 [Bryobacteraceae bacterium]
MEQRMNILREAADQQLLKPFRTHGWDAVVSSEDTSGEYLIVEARKAAATHRVALLYTSATDNRHYKALDAAVDHIFTNGALYDIESFTHGVAKPVTPIGEFFSVLVAWNKELAPDMHKPLPPARARRVRHITGETPLAGIWSRLDQFTSKTLAEKLIRRRATDESFTLTTDIEKKAEGVAFALRNASDYFRGVPYESLNKRILSLYYGVLALALAEMLASPQGPADLNQVEGFTKRGHGLYAVQTGDFGGLSVGLLGRGFFRHWLSFLGHDISHLPESRSSTPTTQSDLEKQPQGTVTTMRQLLSAVPELGDLFLDVFQTAPSWIVPVRKLEDNTVVGSGFGPIGETESTYIRLVDASGRVSEAQIRAAGWPIAEITSVAAGTEGGSEYRARVDHAGHRFWDEVLPVHRSPFIQSPTLILPVIGISEFRTIAIVALYALSILVRYMPSAWWRVEGGDWDEHLSLVKHALGVFERLLPEQFLESIIGERIRASQPGGF